MWGEICNAVMLGQKVELSPNLFKEGNQDFLPSVQKCFPDVSVPWIVVTL